MKIGSLFSGIGGLELGLEWAGVGHVVWQVERDPFPRSVLAKHWPSADRSVTDVREAGAATLPYVDVICGGFPCQDISYAGKGAGLAGERSRLWYEFARVIREMGPRYVVIENVSALIARGLDQVLGTLADIGYDAQWRTIRASDVGAPHRRERLFIVAYAASGDDTREHGIERSSGEWAPSAQDGKRLRPESIGDGRAQVMANASDDGREGAEQARDRSSESGRGDGVRVGVEGCRNDVADTNSHGTFGRSEYEPAERGSSGTSEQAWIEDSSGWSARRNPSMGCAERITKPIVGRDANGLSDWLDRWPAGPGQYQHEWEPDRTIANAINRADRLKALGNAVVPAVAREVGLWLLDIEAQR